MKKLTILLITLQSLMYAQQNRIAQYIEKYYIQEAEPTMIMEEVFDKDIIDKYSKGVERCKIVRINEQRLSEIVKQKKQSLLLTLPFPDNTIHQLKLVSNGFNNNTVDINTSSKQKIEMPHVINYRGIIDNDPKSIAAISFFENDVVGVLSDLNVGNINIGKIAGESNLYVIYFDKDLLKTSGFSCGVIDDKALPSNFEELIANNNKNNQLQTTTTKCIRIYIETAYTIYQNLGNSTSNVSTYVLGMFNVWAAVYQNEGIKIEISEIEIWDTPDPFTHTDSNSGLNTFGTIRSTFNGDYAHFLDLSGNNNGGLAWLGPTCGSSLNYAYSDVDLVYQSLPTYSWDIEVVSHEFGHNLGSNHTHWCGWPGGPIDGCYPVEGGPCTAGPMPPTTTMGTIMSYCHLSSAGIDLALGFGPLPNAVILNEYNTRPCLGPCQCGTVSFTQTVVNASCPGVNDGEINIIPSGGTAPYVFAVNGNVVSQNATGLAAGLYLVTVEDAAQCGRVNPVNVLSTYQSPTITVNSATLCSGSSLTLTPNGAQTYTWSTGATGSSIVVSPTVSTNYTVTGTSAQGCKSPTYALSVVSVNSTPTITANSSYVCSGNSTNISVTGSANSYTWSTNQISTSINVSPTTTTNYTCVGSTASGCTVQAVSTVTVFPNPIVTVSSGSICVGNNITLNASGASSYIWSNNGTAPSIVVSPTVTSVYICIGTNTLGCIGTASTAVVVYPLPNLALTSPSVCSGSSATVQAMGASTYNWSTGSTGSSTTVNPTTTTTYTCNGYSNHGCVKTLTTSVYVIPPPVVALTSGTVCYGMTATVSAAPATTYTWSNGSHSSSFMVVPNATTVYTCQGQAINSCMYLSTTTLVVVSLQTPTITLNGSTLTSSSLTGNQWYLNGVIIPGATGQSYTVSQNGNYSVIVTDGNGCDSSPANKTILDVSIGEFDLKTILSIFPNPAHDQINILLPSDINETIAYRIYNANGQIVKDGICVNEEKTINVSEFAMGLYFIEFSINNHKASFKLIKE